MIVAQGSGASQSPRSCFSRAHQPDAQPAVQHLALQPCSAREGCSSDISSAVKGSRWLSSGLHLHARGTTLSPSTCSAPSKRLHCPFRTAG